MTLNRRDRKNLLVVTPQAKMNGSSVTIKKLQSVLQAAHTDKLREMYRE
jgi:hypothetical protein